MRVLTMSNGFGFHRNLLFLFLLVQILPKFSLAQDEKCERWVDSVYQQLTTEERIAQLMIVRANQPDKPYDPRIMDWIRNYNIGGVTFFKGSPQSQVFQTNQWQQASKTPLLISIDAEWGLAMRLNGTVSYPFQMTLGAIQNDSLIFAMGSQIAEQCKRMGIHLNFAPVVDVNSNAANPVIGVRSFGENPDLVAGKGLLYAKALQTNGIIATAKHFPGHGDTQNDSHYSLPVIKHSRSHFDSIELKPFKFLIDQGIEGIMTAHLNIPALDTTPKLPSTLSYDIITGLLKKELGFKGLIITDGLDMKGVTSVQPSGKIELLALLAGNDLLLLPENVPLAIETIKKALVDGKLPVERLEESCKKVLRFKYRAGLHSWRPAFTENLNTDLNQKHYSDLSQTLFNEAVTLIQNDNDLIPIQNDSTKWAVINIGKGQSDIITGELKSSGVSLQNFEINKSADKTAFDALTKQLKSFSHIIVNLQHTNILANKKFGITDQTIHWLNQLPKEKMIVLNLFASPYALDFLNTTEQFDAILIGYQDRTEVEKAISAILTGKMSAKGKLPVSLKSGFPAGSGMTDISQTRKAAFVPDPEKKSPVTNTDHPILRKIDSLAQDGIRTKAYPGCQIVALKDGKLIYRKSFGYLTYDSTEKVTDTTIYDLASLTKMLATTLVIMDLYEDTLLLMSHTLGDYLPYLNKTDKGQLRIYDVLTHQSGLDGWIPFYLKTIKENKPDPAVYSPLQDGAHPARVADDLYISQHFKLNIFRQIAASKLKKREYRYSDLGFILLPTIAELITFEPFERIVSDRFYEPLKCNSITYLPLTKFPARQIAPTENDREFRQQLLRGDVHDPAAAMLGGVSGHAGLFGTATDVAAIMQMLVNKGTYNGIKFFEPQTVEYFTKTHFKNNRRGLGFDKPPLDPRDPNRSVADAASPESFGHTGFTGTFAWADPKNKLVVVFLSNRVYPDAKTNLLAKKGIRPAIHELFYQYVSKSP